MSGKTENSYSDFFTTEDQNLNESLGYRARTEIANSDLRYLHSPKLFHLNKQRKLEEETKAYHKKGTLIDEFLLADSMDEFNENFILDPMLENVPTSSNQKEFVEMIMAEPDPLDVEDDLIANFHAKCYSRTSKDKAVKMYNEFRDHILFQQKSKERQVYTPEDWAQLVEIKKNARQHKLVNRFLFEPKEGDEVFKHLQIVGMPKWGIEWKGELDLAVINHIDKTIYSIDLKSSAKSINSFAYYYYKAYNYKRQQALYRHLLLWWLQENNIVPTEEINQWTVHTRCIMIKKTDLNEIYCVPVPFDVLQEGDKELQEAAEKIKFYQENGWDNTISYEKNDGLEVLDWEEFLND